MQQPIQIFSTFLFFAFSSLSFAQKTNFCKVAKDSMNAHFERGEMNCYIKGKNANNPEYFVKFFDSHYEKKIINHQKKDSMMMANFSKTVDKSKIKEGTKSINTSSKNNKLQVKIGKDDTLNPNDTSKEYKQCYNQAIQSKLDSAYKCDFFRKSDSIMKAYDKQGKGYKNVEFPGGAGELQKYMNKNLLLPKEIKLSDSDKNVRVYYSFYVDEKGELSELKLIKSNCKSCEASVIQAINKMPKFSPAIEAGKAKKVKYIITYIQKI